MEKRILIVEDEYPIAMDMQQAVQGFGYDVIGIASNYTQAIELLKTVQPDLALLDINLFDSKSGVELAHYIRENYNFPFIYVTAYTDENTFNSVLETFPLGFVHKPIDLLQLQHQLHLAFHNREQSDMKVKALYEELNARQKNMTASFNAATNLPPEFSRLSPREKEVLLFLADGLSDQELADKLFVSITTIRTHLRRIYDKLLVRNRTEAVTMLLKYNLVRS